MVSYAEKEKDVRDHVHLLVHGDDVTLDAEFVVQPPIISLWGGCKWLEKYHTLPLAKKEKTRMRLTALDGVLILARAVASASLLAIVAHGEAGMICAAMLSADVRMAAYRERSVAEAEQKQWKSTCWLSRVW